MKWNEFRIKLPVLGSNIIITDGESLALIEFGLEAKRYLSSNKQDYFPVDYFEDDPESGGEYCFSNALYWCYPSCLLPKKKIKKDHISQIISNMYP